MSDMTNSTTSVSVNQEKILSSPSKKTQISTLVLLTALETPLSAVVLNGLLKDGMDPSATTSTKVSAKIEQPRVLQERDLETQYAMSEAELAIKLVRLFEIRSR